MDGDRAVRVRPGWCGSRRSGRRHPADSCSGARPTLGKHRGSAAARHRASRGALVCGSGDDCHGSGDRGEAPLALVIVGSTAATIAISVVRPIHFAALPQLARGGQELTSANAFSSVADALGAFLGPVLAGVGVAWQGPGLVFVIASVAAVASALLCVHLRLSPRTQPVEAGSEGWRAALAGLRALHRDWGSLSLLLVLANGFVLAGALDVLGVALAEQVLHGGASSAGLIVGAMGVGGLVGAGIATSISHRRRLVPALVAAASSRALRSPSWRCSGTSRRSCLPSQCPGPRGAADGPRPHACCSGPPTIRCWPGSLPFRKGRHCSVWPSEP